MGIVTMHFMLCLTTKVVSGRETVVVDLDSYKQLDGRYNIESCRVQAYQYYDKIKYRYTTRIGYAIYSGTPNRPVLQKVTFNGQAHKKLPIDICRA